MYESTIRSTSRIMPGVTFEVRRVSYGGRLELLKRVRELAARQAFHLSSEGAVERLDAEIAGREIRLKMIRWGLVRVDGLLIDGEAPAVDALIEYGPEGLVAEIAAAVEGQLSLTEEERKN
jgi:hypothetical protein